MKPKRILTLSNFDDLDAELRLLAAIVLRALLDARRGCQDAQAWLSDVGWSELCNQ